MGVLDLGYHFYNFDLTANRMDGRGWLYAKTGSISGPGDPMFGSRIASRSELGTGGNIILSTSEPKANDDLREQLNAMRYANTAKTAAPAEMIERARQLEAMLIQAKAQETP